MSQLAVTARNVELRRGGNTIVPDLDLEVPTGTLLGLVGPSGSGKTTVMRALLGLGAVHAGELSLFGHPAGAVALREKVGYMPQNGGTWADLTARECLEFSCGIYRVPTSRVDELLALMELEAVADRPLATLSGGQERRVGLAMAILQQPSLLVLDEPTVGLDPRLRNKIWNEFRTWSTAGTTLIVSTHVMSEAEECDRVAILMEGRLIADDTPAGIMQAQKAANMEEALLHLFEKEEQNVS